MPPIKVILLACGSFNPPTNMHLRMFEIARDHLHRLGNHVVIGGLISPVHDGYGKKELEASTHRLNMIRLALQTSDWIKLSEWECKQESWSRTRQVLQYHQNHLNALLHKNYEYNDKLNEDDVNWVPENVKNSMEGPIQIKLLCGADLLESFGTPGLWADEDIESIVGQHGLVVVTRSKTNPNEFIYNSDVLTKYMSNITIVTEWIQNEVSSTKIRKALRRSESVKYLLPDKVIDYIIKHNLYGCKNTVGCDAKINSKVRLGQMFTFKTSWPTDAPKIILNIELNISFLLLDNSKYLTPEYNSNFLTPSPSDVLMESPSPTNCMIICNNTLFNRNYDNKRLSIDTVDSITKTNILNTVRHPGQAVKIITESSGDHKIIKEDTKEASLVRPACLL